MTAFRLLLFIIGIKLRISAIASGSFRRKLRLKDMSLVIRVENGPAARTFRIERGRFRSRAGRDPSATTELVWRDAGTAVRTMLSKNELDGFSAIGKGFLRITGDFENALRFMDLAG